MKDRNKSTSRFVAGVDLIARLCAWISGGLFLTMAAMITCDVIFRKVFGKPIHGVVQFSEFILLYATFFGAVWLLKLHAHIRITIVQDLISPRVQKVFTYFSSTVCFLTSIVIFWQSSLATWDAFSRGTLIATLVGIFDIPKFPLLAVIPFASLLFGFYFAIDILHEIRSS